MRWYYIRFTFIIKSSYKETMQPWCIISQYYYVSSSNKCTALYLVKYLKTYAPSYFQIYKQPAFGRLQYNICLLDGYTPSMFSNGIPHEKQKTFLIQICKLAQESRIFDASLKLFKEYAKIWQNAGEYTFNLTV